MVAQIDGLVGHEGATAVQAMIESARKPAAGILASIFGGCNRFVWRTSGRSQYDLDVPDQPGNGFIGILKNRFLSFTMVLGIGFLLLVSLLVRAGVAAAGHFLAGIFPIVAFVGPLVNFLVTILVTTLLLAMIYKYLPNVEIGWSDV